MNLLAIETSSGLCSVALLTGDSIMEQEAEAGQEHSAMLLPMISRVLRSRNLALNQLDGIAFGAGPGSFTGLRIACGVAQGLAAGAGLKLAAVSTLQALAEEARSCGNDGTSVGRVIACIDARMGEIYHAAYERESTGWRECSPPGIYSMDAMPVQGGGGWVGAGSGFKEHGERLRARQPLIAVRPELRPRARSIAVLARMQFSAGLAMQAARALPEYLRDKVALTISERNHERNPAI